MNDPSSHMMNRGPGIWHPAAAPGGDPMPFQKVRPVFTAGAGAKSGRMNWKRKKAAAAATNGGGGGGGASGYQPPALKELQFQNRLKARRFYPKKKFSRFAPSAPFNTTSFIMRAKKAGGVASLVSPCPVTPAILPTPKFSPSREGLVDMAKEEWGVDGYGSMKGLIRLRPGGGGGMEEIGGGEDEELEEASSESDVEEHLEVERRLDHDLSRFEMVYPNHGEEQGAAEFLLESRVDDQDTNIARIEEENLTLKERLFLMEREMEDMRRRLVLLESREGNNNINLNAIEEASENDGGGDVCSEKSAGDCEESNETMTPMHD